MNEYSDADRKKDFDYFVENYHQLYEKYGHKFLAIKNQKILGAYDSAAETIEKLSEIHPVGTYIIQECTGDESAYRATIMRLIIKG